MNCWPSGKYVHLLYMYSILGRGSFALITASIRRGMEVISLWHCWGGMEAQVSLTVAFSSSAFFGLLFLIFLLTIPHRFSMGFRSGEFAGQSSTPTPWQFNQLLVLLAVWAGRFHRLWKLNTGLQATWAMSFSTLLPDSRTLVSKWNTKLALIWKEDFGPLGNSPVLLLLSPGKTPLTLSVVQEWLNKRNTTTVAKFLDTTTVAKFLDTSVCGGYWCLDPSLSPFLVKFTQILESILLDNPHKAAVHSVGCASFSSTLFPSTQLSVNMLGYSTLWTASFFGNDCLWLTLLVKGVNDCLLDNCQISSLPHDCVASEPNWETILKAQETFAGVLSWLAYHHILICWDSELVGFVKCEPKSSQLKEPKT